MRRSSARGISSSELVRKLIHMGAGVGAFAVVLLGPWRTAALTCLLTLFNLIVLPRLGGRRMWRIEEKRRDFSIGMVLYPLVLLFLTLLCWQRLDIVAAAWSILAFGDGAATICGRVFGQARLPWNSGKSWAGALAFWLFGTLGSSAVLLWTSVHQGRDISPIFLLGASASIALIAALVESLPLMADDNLTVPIVSASLLWLAL